MLWTGEYDRARALAYAERWAFARNPLFYNFTGVGGDCTNFVSQCVLAGCCVMNGTPDFGWYYRDADDRAPAWTGVPFFWDFFTGAPTFRAENGGVGPFGREAAREDMEPGDVIQLGRENGEYYHTLLVLERVGREIYVAAHSNDVYDRPLSTYNAPQVRFLHIEGVRIDLPQPTCFVELLNGTALPEPL